MWDICVWWAIYYWCKRVEINSDTVRNCYRCHLCIRGQPKLIDSSNLHPTVNIVVFSDLASLPHKSLWSRRDGHGNPRHVSHLVDLLTRLCHSACRCPRKLVDYKYEFCITRCRCVRVPQTMTFCKLTCRPGISLCLRLFSRIWTRLSLLRFPVGACSVSQESVPDIV